MPLNQHWYYWKLLVVVSIRIYDIICIRHFSGIACFEYNFLLRAVLNVTNSYAHELFGVTSFYDYYESKRNRYFMTIFLCFQSQVTTSIIISFCINS